MKCEKVSQELIAYVGGRIESADRHEIEEHLAECAGCRTRAEELRGMWSVMDELPAIEPSFGFDARVRQRVAAEPQRGWFSWFVPQARVAFAAMLLVAMTVWVVKGPIRNSGTPGTVTGTTTPPAATEQDFNAIKDLGVLENYDVVTKMDALSELVPADEKTQTPSLAPTESND